MPLGVLKPGDDRNYDTYKPGIITLGRYLSLAGVIDEVLETWETKGDF